MARGCCVSRAVSITRVRAWQKYVLIKVQVCILLVFTLALVYFLLKETSWRHFLLAPSATSTADSPWYAVTSQGFLFSVTSSFDCWHYCSAAHCRTANEAILNRSTVLHQFTGLHQYTGFFKRYVRPWSNDACLSQGRTGIPRQAYQAGPRDIPGSGGWLV